MLILYESAAGYSLFRVMDEGKLKTKNVDNIYKEFETQKKRMNFIQLHAFQPFKDMDEASEAAKCIHDGEKLHKSLSKMIKKNVIKKDLTSQKIGVIDAKIGSMLHDKYSDLNIVSDAAIVELHRGIREHLTEFLSELNEPSIAEAMNLGLSHVLSRHKIQFSAEKVDTMIIQAIALLDELDKEVNIYAMRVKEWYGWHYPEMNKIISDNMQYCRIINKVGYRKNIAGADLSDIVEEDVEQELKNMSKISMGSEISQSDLSNIQSLSEQVLDLSIYRNELYDYLRNRMLCIAPNLTMMVGELVGARLLSHAGSLVNLAKYPASTVQILGAEKALFRALKTKSDTPKYGLIYHASFVNAATQMNKAKIARTLACKTSLSARIDAFSISAVEGKTQTDDAEEDPAEMGAMLWQKMQKRIDYVEGHKVLVKSKTLAGNVRQAHSFMAGADTANDADDFQVSKKRKLSSLQPTDDDQPKKKKLKTEDDGDDEKDVELKKEKKEKKEKKSKKEKKEKKKKKKKKSQEE